MFNVFELALKNGNALLRLLLLLLPLLLLEEGDVDRSIIVAGWVQKDLRGQPRHEFVNVDHFVDVVGHRPTVR